jgi:hypothetical protein
MLTGFAFSSPLIVVSCCGSGWESERILGWFLRHIHVPHSGACRGSLYPGYVNAPLSPNGTTRVDRDYEERTGGNPAAEAGVLRSSSGGCERYLQEKVQPRGLADCILLFVPAGSSRAPMMGLRSWIYTLTELPAPANTNDDATVGCASRTTRYETHHVIHTTRNPNRRKNGSERFASSFGPHFCIPTHANCTASVGVYRSVSPVLMSAHASATNFP